jgi:hypothetical protein
VVVVVSRSGRGSGKWWIVPSGGGGPGGLVFGSRKTEGLTKREAPFCAKVWVGQWLELSGVGVAGGGVGHDSLGWTKNKSRVMMI